MTEPLEQRIIEIIQAALRNPDTGQSVIVTADDSMETVAAWDSLSFMRVFSAINAAFGLDPDFDDAIHYTSVRTLCAYLSEQAGG